MEVLTELEKSLVKVISERHPFSYKECEEVYISCKSFDTTMVLLNMANSAGVSPSKFLQKIKKYKKYKP